MYRKERATQAICSCDVDHHEVVAQNEFTKERKRPAPHKVMTQSKQLRDLLLGHDPLVEECCSRATVSPFGTQQ